MNNQPLRREILIGGLIDELQYGELLYLAKEYNGVSDPDLAKKCVIDTVSELTADGMSVILPASDLQTQWSGSLEDSKLYLEELVRECSVIPGLGDGFWVVLTEKGKKAAEQIGDDD